MIAPEQTGATNGPPGPGARDRSHLRGAPRLLAAALLALGFVVGQAPWATASAQATLAPAQGVGLRVATEPEILAEPAAEPSVFRFADNPRVIVLSFASPRAQGLTLNRVAALVEKAGLPRDRVLDDPALAEAIRAAGRTPETYYAAHDYRAVDLVRFFALADRDGVALNASEGWLRSLIRELGWLVDTPVAALVSIAGADGSMDLRIRSAMLRHELSHAEYFTEPAYTAHVRRFWTEVLGEEERERFRRWLAAEGYDADNEDLMMNEMQAYLVHTPGFPLSSVASLGLRPDRVSALRVAFLSGMPHSWLREAGSATASSPP